MSENLFELFTEVTGPAQLRPIAWTGAEELCGGFKLELVAVAPVALADTLATQLFGQRATFVVNGPSALVRRGVIASVAIGGSDDVDSAEISLSIVPKLELMKLRTQSRVFQGISTVDVLTEIARSWQLPFELRLMHDYSRRRYITQYRETDLEFLRRIASRDGIGFYLEHGELGPEERQKPGDEKIVFFDNAQAYPPLPPGADATLAHRLVHDRERFGAHEHHVTGFRLERRIAPEMIRMGDFDFKKPRLALRASAAVSPEQRSPINTSMGGEQLLVYLHADRAELDVEGGKGEISDHVAAVRLSQAQREAMVGRGKSRCLRLAPGLGFVLEEESQAPSLNQAYVVTRVEHKGRVPELSRGAGTEPVYENTFECAPAAVVFRPPLPALDLRQVTETATVVGPDGSELHTDEHGRVKVRFHWDMSGSSEGSCWLRVLTTWAGANWGSQFLPRVGMEVLVGFLSGDVDQPIVLGAVYNGTHPTPFALPEEAAKSGFKTQSVPGGEGGSEITFDDTKGRELFVLRGERDMQQSTEHDLNVEVGHDQVVHVGGSLTETIKKTLTSQVEGSRIVATSNDAEHTVGGSHLLSVTGNSELRVTGRRNVRLEGREHVESFSDTTRVVHSDAIERVLGHKITVVGEHDARRSISEHVEGSVQRFSTSTHEIVSDKEIVLRSGESVLRLSPEGLELIASKVRFVTEEVALTAEDKVELFAKKQLALVAENIDVLADKRAIVAGEKARLKLTQDARLDGSVVKLNCDPEPPDPLSPPEYEPPEPTGIELSDEQGGPLAHKRFVLIKGDGSEQTGILDESGKAEVFLDEACEITFPDVDGARRS